MYQERIAQAERDMGRVISSFGDDLKAFHTGRSSAALVEEVSVSYYGTPTPLKHVASIVTPDPKMIVITPWDKSILADIENAIRTSDLGINPVNDGNAVRVAIPPMTEDRRKELVKKLHQTAEEVKVALRTLRRDAWDEIQEMEKGGKISEDDRYAAEKQLNKIIDDLNDKIDDLVGGKEREILTI